MFPYLIFSVHFETKRFDLLLWDFGPHKTSYIFLFFSLAQKIIKNHLKKLQLFVEAVVVVVVEQVWIVEDSAFVVVVVVATRV